jgi:hypothetical protein
MALHQLPFDPRVLELFDDLRAHDLVFLLEHDIRFDGHGVATLRLDAGVRDFIVTSLREWIARPQPRKSAR